MNVTTQLLKCYEATTIEMEVPFFGSTTFIEIIKKLAGAVDLVYDSQNDKELRKREGRHFFHRTTRRFAFRWGWYQTQQKAPQKFKVEMTEIFQPTFLKFVSESTSPFYKDGWELLKYMIESMDWTYDMSDDSSVYYGGENHRKRMEIVAKEMYAVDQKKYLTLVSKILKKSDYGKYLLDTVWLTGK